MNSITFLMSTMFVLLLSQEAVADDPSLSCASTAVQDTQAFQPVKAVQNALASDGYLDGESYCEKNIPASQRTFGFYVSVPINYGKPELGQIKLFVYSMRKFNPTNPTVIYVDGGPGGQSHGGPMRTSPQTSSHPFRDINTNVLMFDQRGIACSRPSTAVQYANPVLYSTENTVRDMEAIRQQLKIDKWTIYGQSYGTRPAIVYGHQFPNHARGIILESISTEQGEELSPAGEKLRADLASNYQVAIDNLPEKLKSQLIKTAEANPDWRNVIFPNYIFNIINTFGNGPQTTAYLAAAIPHLIPLAKPGAGVEEIGEGIGAATTDVDGPIFSAEMKKLLKTSTQAQIDQAQDPGLENADIPDVDPNVMHAISCREVDSFAAGRSTTIALTAGKVQVQSADAGSGACSDVDKSLMTPISMDNFPLQVPTIVVAGQSDMATPATGTKDFYTQNVKGKGLLVTVNNSGHNPIRMGILQTDGISLLQGPVSPSGAEFSNLIDKFVATGELPSQEAMKNIQSLSKRGISFQEK